jgi:hypothetical protein
VGRGVDREGEHRGISKGEQGTEEEEENEVQEAGKNERWDTFPQVGRQDARGR